MTKLILTHEVSGLGEPGDVIDVKNGYARNYLLPRNLATVWTQGGEKQVEAIRAARRAHQIASIEEALAAREALESTPVLISAKAGSTGRLFGTVTTSDIVQAISDAQGVTVDKRKIEVPGHIKSVGSYEVRVRLHPEVQATVKIEVEPQGS